MGGGKLLYRRNKVECESPHTKRECEAAGGKYIAEPVECKEAFVPLPPEGLKWASKIERPSEPCTEIGRDTMMCRPDVVTKSEKKKVI